MLSNVLNTSLWLKASPSLGLNVSSSDSGLQSLALLTLIFITTLGRRFKKQKVKLTRHLQSYSHSNMFFLILARLYCVMY